MADTPETLADALAAARAMLDDDSWIDEVTALDEDGEPDDFAQRVVRVNDVRDALDRIEAAVAAHRAKECEQCIHDRVRDEEMKTRAEQMSPAEETDFTLFEMRRAAENGRMAIKENPPVRSALECYVDNTLAYANRLEDSIARERRRAATKLSLAELHIKTLQKQFKHHGELE